MTLFKENRSTYAIIGAQNVTFYLILPHEVALDW